mgnify:CR=1 FL=1
MPAEDHCRIRQLVNLQVGLEFLPCRVEGLLRRRSGRQASLHQLRVRDLAGELPDGHDRHLVELRVESRIGPFEGQVKGPRHKFSR